MEIKKCFTLVIAFLLVTSFIAVNISAAENVSDSEDSLLTSTPENKEAKINFEEIEDKAGAVPGDTFYFLDRAFDVFKSSEKLADERAYEFAVLVDKSAEEEVDSDTIEKARERYEKVMEKAQNKAKKNGDASERIATSTTNHLEALSMVYDKVPEEAKQSIEGAMEISMSGRDKAIEALRGLNESRAEKAQEISNKAIQERVSEEVRNRVREGIEKGIEERKGGSGEGMPKGDVNKEDYEKFKNSLEENPEYHVEYEFNSSEGKIDVVDMHTKDGKTRVNVDGSDEYSFWMNGESVVEYEEQCIDLEAVKGYGVDPMSIYDKSSVSKGSIESEDEYLEVSSAGTENIAGKETECYDFVYETETYNQLTTYCLTDEGIPAKVETINRDSGDLVSGSEAKVIEDSVDEDVLEPCEPDTEMPSF